MRSIFLQPYPCHIGLKRNLLSGLFFGGFVFVFLWFFRPFGLTEIKNREMVFLLSGYGLVTAFIIVVQGILFPLFFRSYFKEENWTVIKEIFQTLVVIFLIGIGNLVYSFWLGMFELTVGAFLSFQLFTILIAVLPVTILVLFQQIRLLKKNLAETKKISGDIFNTPVDQTKHVYFPVQLIAENGKDLFTALSQHVFYILSADNYIEIIYSENNQVKKTILRSSLKRTQEQLGRHPGFYRCHRTCIVNLSKVKSLTGNAQGYKLILENIEEKIPVSRDLKKEIASVLKDVHG